MARLSLRPMEYRHVVFPDAPGSDGLPVNFTPACVAQAPAPTDDLTSDEQQCVRWMFGLAGVNLDDYRFETVKRRIPACLRALRIDSIGQVRAAVQHQPDLLKTAISALVIGVTSFFRDLPVFDFLAGSVLPEVLSRSSGPRIWSAGCSDGAELYSVAMLLAERGAIRRCALLGTDCRVDAVARAREGCYDGTVVKSVPAGFLERYFTFDGAAWRVHPYLRRVVQWRGGNVLTTIEPGAWDLILCRNLAIYMQPAAAARLWEHLARCLRPGGFLVLGKAERPYGSTGLKAVAPCIYRRDRS